MHLSPRAAAPARPTVGRPLFLRGPGARGRVAGRSVKERPRRRSWTWGRAPSAHGCRRRAGAAGRLLPPTTQWALPFAPGPRGRRGAGLGARVGGRVPQTPEGRVPRRRRAQGPGSPEPSPKALRRGRRRSGPSSPRKPGPRPTTHARGGAGGARRRPRSHYHAHLTEPLLPL